MPYIPEELQTKITLMAYQLSPHPLATIFNQHKTFYSEGGINLYKLEFYDFLDDVPYKYTRHKDLILARNDLIIRFLPPPCSCPDRIRAVFKFELWNHMDDDTFVVVQERAWKSRTPFDYLVKDIIKDLEPMPFLK